MNASLSPSQKIAYILIALDPVHAETILSLLTPEEKQQVGIWIDQLSTVSPEITRLCIEEFMDDLAQNSIESPV